MFAMRRRVLILGANRELLLLRAAVLRAAGSEVDVTESKQQTLELLRDRNYDAMVICCSISGDSAPEYVTLFRERNPQECVAYIGEHPWHRPTTIQADTLVSGTEGPDALIEMTVVPMGGHLSGVKQDGQRRESCESVFT
jgi:CheY-like chemotaxis protein